ncbi:MAG: lamin tail domain-containing protein, partial [Candidatus Saccharibacteria bacterium]|nr:lamin tail domain-containing protein [Candidatus Saccharibacteria bacterium]
MDEFKRRICAVGLSIGLMSTQLPIAFATGSPLSESEAITETSSISEERTEDLEDSNLSDEEDESSENDSELPILYFKAINPGYTDNVGEMIEIRKNTNESVSLSGVVLRYSNSSGVTSDLVEFLDGARLDGDSLVLRYKSAADVDEKDPLKNANLVYSKTLAKSAGLELVVRDGKKEKALDSICWTGKAGCYDNFSKNPDTTLVFNDERRVFLFQDDYKPEFSNDALFTPTIIGEEGIDEDSNGGSELMPQRLDVEFSEILSYYEDEAAEQFIELYNSTDEDISLDGCKIRYKKKDYPLSGIISAGGYYVYRPTDFHLTKNPNTEN